MANGNVLAQVETIVILMLENRSFDHMLGHLSLPPINSAVDGLRNPLDEGRYDNTFEGRPYAPFAMRDGKLPSDLPHERAYVTTQLAYRGTTARYEMDGFVRAYYEFTQVNRTDYPETVGFFPQDQVPITSFLARSFGVCDQWYAPVPTSTLPNRLMFLAGTTAVDATGGVFPPIAGTFLLDWLTARGVPWRIYHAGAISFFWLLGKFDVVLGDGCRDFDHFAQDVATEPVGQFPKVILVEPCYGDAPLGPKPNDNHAPEAVAPGEALVHDVYAGLIANPARWARTVFIVTYDEHGGFYDHVPPLAVRQAPPAGAQFNQPFATTGPRVPGIVVSPFVPPGTQCHAALDHTSILQLLAERFGTGPTDYSAEVTARRGHGIRSLSEALTGPVDPRRPAPPAPPPEPQSPAGPYDRPSVWNPSVAPTAPPPMQQAFRSAAVRMVEQFGAQAEAKFPGITAWRRSLGA